jgi:DNA adenine methylase
MNDYIASPLNYIGGKYKILPQIIPLFPKNIRNFVDLFCGGCNVGINVQAKNVIFNDNLSYLIDLYKAFNSLSIFEVIDFIERRIKEFDLSLTNQEGYIQLRKLYNSEKNPLDLFVLTAYSFNHQIRFNNSHEFNNPFGKERSCFNPRMKENLVSFLSKLKNTKSDFSSSNFDEFDFSNFNCNDFVYCDPPYLITTGTYNDGKRGFTGWNEKEERKLLTVLSKLESQNVKFALSNVIEHKGRTNEILKNWISESNLYVTYLNKNYANSNYHTNDRNKNTTIEVLVTNYQPSQEQLVLKFA